MWFQHNGVIVPTEIRQRILTYGASVPRRRRRWVRRIAIYAMAGIALAAVMGWGLCRLPDVIAYRRAMSYTAPPDQVVFDNDPAEAAKLIGTGYYTEVCANYKDRPGLNGAVRTIRLGGKFDWFEAMFLHRRRVPGQKDFHLVAVGGVGGLRRSPSGCRVSFNAFCYPPEGVAIPENTVTPAGQVIDIPPGGRLRIFAGQPDPADDSHLTIRYELNGIPGLIEGWLRNESCDGVELKITSGPAATER